MSKSELKEELGIGSLAARRYLWEHIQKLRYRQQASDASVAVALHEAEIDHLAGSQNMDGQEHVDHEVLGTLRHEAAMQRQVLEDAMLAYRLAGMSLGQQFVEDSELAGQEQQHFDMQAVQSEYDRLYAQTLAPARARTSGEMNQEVKSLMKVCIETCAGNGVNVAEALGSGQIQIINRKPRFQPVHDGLANVEEYFLLAQDIERCAACFEEGATGFVLPCSHQNCTACMRRLFETALRDSSLLPLKCCERPIDMAIAKVVLKKPQVDILEERLLELQAERKMYCPNCSRFINLDALEDSQSLVCMCGTHLCTICSTASHPGVSCDHNQAIASGSDAPFLEMASSQGWKQCPGCSIVVELTHGCNHMTCSSCSTQFCYHCLALCGIEATVCVPPEDASFGKKTGFWQVKRLAFKHKSKLEEKLSNRQSDETDFSTHVVHFRHTSFVTTIGNMSTLLANVSDAGLSCMSMAWSAMQTVVQPCVTRVLIIAFLDVDGIEWHWHLRGLSISKNNIFQSYVLYRLRITLLSCPHVALVLGS